MRYETILWGSVPFIFVLIDFRANWNRSRATVEAVHTPKQLSHGTHWNYRQDQIQCINQEAGWRRQRTQQAENCKVSAEEGSYSTCRCREQLKSSTKCDSRDKETNRWTFWGVNPNISKLGLFHRRMTSISSSATAFVALFNCFCFGTLTSRFHLKIETSTKSFLVRKPIISNGKGSWWKEALPNEPDVHIV